MAESDGMDWEHEVSTDATLAGELVAEQFEEWSRLPVIHVDAVSTDNDIYRLGDHLALRLPRRGSAVAAIDKEHTWLPRLAASLPLKIPLPIARGQPSRGYPFPWSVVEWLDGAPVGAVDAKDSSNIAYDLARFILALHGNDAAGGPVAGEHNHWRGAPLNALDVELRRRFTLMADIPDIGEIIAAWERGLAVDVWAGPLVWVHGDLKGSNLLLRNEALHGVLDWGLTGVGDPACDLSAAWSLFRGNARAAFREAVEVDNATWARGRAWALIEGVLALSYYRGRQEDLAQAGRRVLDQVLADERD
ncbi:aminoglycoside phosphotransferase family protein [Sphingosinicella sp. GR2756]|uniref:Aminoglycoside phosphotransferase family protein n=1 Tax=Sphingosinicella rhizophila TaxID=3050082 RepID=A0ABU3Q550_9SPHN|nr:aminoglycoside phosphotransferase family protein [Sphingosinicella sp. GR2756]